MRAVKAKSVSEIPCDQERSNDFVIYRCLFPSCTCLQESSSSRIEIHLGYAVNHGMRVVIEGAACKQHTNFVKGRKQKRDMSLQQHSHMRNALYTLSAVLKKSCNESVNDVRILF